MVIQQPKALQKGDTIALIAPSSGLATIFPHRIDSALTALKDLGFKVKVFPTVKLNSHGKAGSIKQRVNDIHKAFSDKSVNAIICVIGGLCANELLDSLDYKLIAKNPKIFCGYSDITLLHYALRKKSKLLTFYGPCAMTQFGEFPKPLKYTTEHFFKALGGKIGSVSASGKWTDEILDWGQKKDLEGARKLRKNSGWKWIQKGKAKAPIIGGCLSSLLQLTGTSYDVDYKGKILFLDIPEGEEFMKGTPPVYVDSQLTDLKNRGVFDTIKGLIIGRPFRYSQDQDTELQRIVKERCKGYTFPVLYGFDIGHTDPMVTIPLGVMCSIDSTKNKVSFDESGVALD